jgi:pimeloyl-ACP methyl ester carboxylesterase
MSIQPFSISVSPYVIEELRERLGRARWPDEIPGSGWEYGANLEYMQALCAHWGHGFDWKEQEDALNIFHHFQAEIDGFCLHFIHEKGKGGDEKSKGRGEKGKSTGEKANGPDPIPILLIHGYPDSFARFVKLIPLLTQPGPGGLCFDVIVPSIPGFGFSGKPTQPGMNTDRIANLFARLMKEELGYSAFIVHGGDWGSSIAEQMAIGFPELLLGIHLTDVPYRHLLTEKPEHMTEAEKKYLQAGKQWQMQEGAYAMLQGTKPQTLAYGMNDSPIGLAAWIIEKFYSWTDHNGDLQHVYTRDELLTNLTIYWVTQTAGSAFRIYYETMHHPPAAQAGRIEVPAAVFMAPKDLVPAPREFAERILNVRRWTQLPAGGHFAAMEQPIRLADDIVSFAKVLALRVPELR